ncbi:hypothetical protein FQB35_10380 [Crassaminicella thermophila]|uniref:Uncharacterized protein n=1 Tax=Crassaminicella thermophila TaxID=2599308 RepID=A0A5C0SDR6_CRATE|nr:hypothetical protein [Crassaminicella thermophila]QEK12705.1 hypothetical protein FQB35_10380 [Crassaminicella thermophila]
MSSFQRKRDRENKQNNYNTSELATVTSSDTGQGINANGVGEYREIPLIAPFGIRWNPPSGKSVELIKNWFNGKTIVAVGTEVDTTIPAGETEIYSMGGATIRCKNNGDVVINNAVVIKKDGSVVIQNNMSVNGDVTINKSLNVTDGITTNGTVKAGDFKTI